MEGLKKRSIAVIGLLLVAGLLITLGTRAPSEPKTEQWLLDNSPKELQGFTMVRGSESDDYSYRMDERTYGELAPYGIVARVYRNPETGEEYDVVLIASRSKDSFHDPRICFTAQGWALSNQWSEPIETKTRGTVSATMTTMDGTGGHNKIAAFIYRGQGEFYKSTSDLKIGMFIEQFKGGNDLDGVFYRFIPQHEREDQNQQAAELKRFIAQFLDAANEFSKGYF
jgi:hypothetical protein